MSKINNSTFNKLRVKNVKPETESAVTITFDIPKELQDKYIVKAGQYIKLRTMIDDIEQERYYSICSFNEDSIQIGVKRVDNGIFSNYACDSICSGDIIDVEQPQGDFCLLNSEIIKNEKKYFFVAAGSGITPNLAMIKTLLNNYDNIEINLLYINGKRSDIMFFEELEELKNSYLNRLNIVYILTREQRGIPLLSQRPDAETAGLIIDNFIGKNIDQVYMCGPLPLIDLFRNTLLGRNVPKKSIHMELFGTPTVTSKKINTVSTDDEIKNITVISQGVKQDIKIRPDQNILDAALEGGITVPFACKGGVCATCKAKCLDGKSDMVLNYGLEDDEVEQGMVLTCQTFVTSESGTYDFDVQ